MVKWRLRFLAISLLLAPTTGAMAQELSEADFFAELPEVLTASRLSQPLMDAPNSVTVLDRKLIEATGYRNLSDLFRLVPGMYVGQEKGWFHNVSLHLADSFARRMQVLIDGRSVYLPSFGGVRWDALPLAIEDIERIEVVRGSNAASFGANSFTGVINIITRHPEDVAGRMLHLSGGDHAHQEGWFRWAGQGGAASHRITLGRREDGGFINQFDDERSDILNYRGDYALAGGESLSIQLGYLQGERGSGDSITLSDLPHDQHVKSYSLQVDYRRMLSGDREWMLKASLDHLLTREVSPAAFPPVLPAGSYSLLDLLSRRWHVESQLNSEHAAGLRSSVGAYLRRDQVQSDYYFNVADTLSADSWGVFGHLEWRIAPEWLANMGAFLEGYDTVGTRLSPRLTLHWQPSSRHAWRLGMSRAYRNPALLETYITTIKDFLGPNGVSLGLPPTQPYFVAAGPVDPEVLLSQELGYLGKWPEQGLDLDVRIFNERISDLIDASCTSPVTRTCSGIFPINPRRFDNIGGAGQKGIEGQLKWQPSALTGVIVNYAAMDIDSGINDKRYSPSQQYGLHVMHEFSGGLDMTLSHYWLPAFNPIGQGDLHGYKRLDARLAKRFRLDGSNGQIALVWQNLTDDYIEFSDDTLLNGTPYNLFDSRFQVNFQLEF